MGKDKYGISYEAYAIMAFAFAILGMRSILVILMIILLAVVKNDWASRQAIQALTYSFVARILHHVASIGTHIHPVFFPDFSDGFIRGVINLWFGSFSWIKGVISLIAFVFLIIGLIRVCQGKEAELPLADKLAKWIMKSMPKEQRDETI